LIPVTLVAGANKIRLETTVSSEFAMIDWIEISGNNPTEASCSAATGARMVTQNEGAETNVIVEGSPVVVPNPTQGLSTVRFTISGQQKVIVNLYGADGRLVSTLANRLFAAGTHALPVDYKGLQKGVYFISVSYGGKQRILQNILTR
jgi:type IX secretion system substrate protein